MKIEKNENTVDRLIRILLCEIFIILAFFWTGGVLSIILYILAAIMLITAITGFCLLYLPFSINTLKKYPGPVKRLYVYLLIALYIILAIAGIYFSNFFSKKIFLNDFNAMNNHYKQTLFLTGQNKRQESIDNYDKLVSEYDRFHNKYSSYHPYVLKGDGKLNQDLENIRNKISGLKEKVYSGDLADAHKDFEEIRPVFQDILKRNKFSLFAVYLVDFHDSMEKLIDASDKKDADRLIEEYNDANNKLISVEQESNDDEIKAIRGKLEELLSLAKEGKNEELSGKAAELKSSFVKVYLKRG